MGWRGSQRLTKEESRAEEGGVEGLGRWKGESRQGVERGCDKDAVA